MNEKMLTIGRRVKATLIKDRKIIMAAFACGLIFTAVAVSKDYAENAQKDIAENVIRFHVRANSNSDKDQSLKVAVKDKILEQFQEELEQSNSIEETRDFLFLKIPEIEQVAEAEIRERGYDYPVTVALVQDYFPTKFYGDLSIPPGNYEALRVDIGNSDGNNWWCVMYPPLCYVDVSHEKVSDSTKTSLKNTLQPEQYSLVNEKSNDATVKVKFKIVEMWQKAKEKDAGKLALKE